MNTYPETTGKHGFLSDGIAELKRKWHRRKTRRQLRKLEKQQAAAVLALGRAAWQHQLYPEGSASTIQTLQELSGQSASVNQQQEQLRQAITAHQGQQQTHQAEQDQLLQAARAARSDAEAQLKQLQATVNQQQASADNTKNRLAAIGQEQQALQQTPPADGSDPADRLGQLQQEQAQLTDYLTQVEQYLASVAPSLASLKEKLSSAQNHENQVHTERNRILAEDDRKLRELQSQMQAHTATQSGLSRRMDDALQQLGADVIQSGMADPSVGSEIQAVQQLDRQADENRRVLTASLACTEAMPGSTMPLFFGVVAGIPILLVTLILVSIFAIGQWKDLNRSTQLPQQTAARQQPAINPYLEHPLKQHVAYRLAKKMFDARDDRSMREARTGVYRICKEIHLGIYFADGRTVLRGSERSNQDFYLYEFMRNMLAKSYINHTVTGFDAHTNMMARLIARTDNVEQYDEALRELLYQKYMDAKANPDDPNSFLALMLDGLARYQDIPYSFEELLARDTGELELDDIQSFLIMLDLYIPPPPHQTTWLNDLNNALLPTVYAASPCDRIKGDNTRAAWGMGQGAVADIAAHFEGTAAGTAGDVAGKANLITGLIGDILILRGIQLKIEPTGGLLVNLPHVKKGTDPRDYPTVQLTAVATFECELDQDVVQCGWLLGKSIPKDGPLKNVEITWDFQPALTRLQFHDAREFHANTRMLTDADGRATVTLRTTPCPEPKGRKLAGQHHKVKAAARYVSAEMPNPLAALGGLSITIPISMLPGFYEIVTGGRKAYTTIDIGWHEKRPDDEQY